MDAFEGLRLMDEVMTAKRTGVPIAQSSDSAVKAATSALFLAAAKEARKHKIRVLDIRPPHTETGLAQRAIAGVAPKMPNGADPDAVAQRIVEAILGNERELPSSAFS